MLGLKLLSIGGAEFSTCGAKTRPKNLILIQGQDPRDAVGKAIANLGVKGHPIGPYGLYGFFDAGNVALTPGQLTAQALRTNVDIGASIAIQNKLVFRAYYGFGTGEGNHLNAKAANTFAVTPPINDVSREDESLPAEGIEDPPSVTPLPPPTASSNWLVLPESVRWCGVSDVQV